jgi:xanthine dehydrogenase accessory factor
MRDSIQQLHQFLCDGRDVAYCRLVETRGSTPQKAGALMLVFADGSQAGTLGGGCVEAEVKRRALAVLARGEPEVARFQLDSDYGWDDGLICGGRMQVLIEPLAAGRRYEYFEELGRRLDQGAGVTEAIVFEEKQNDLPLTASFLFDAEGRLAAAMHINHPEQAAALVSRSLKTLSDRPRPYAEAGVSYLPALPRCRLVIVGGGHVGKAVGSLAAELDFDVWVIDDREEYVSQERFPLAQRRICGPIDEVLPSLEITPDTYCLIVTRGHNHDEEALYYLADRGARYVGLIGSRRKIKMIFDDLLNEGISPEALAKVYAPLGVDIGSQTVPEIAVSICAELVAHRNLGGRVPGRPRSVEIQGRVKS